MVPWYKDNDNLCIIFVQLCMSCVLPINKRITPRIKINTFMGLAVKFTNA